VKLSTTDLGEGPPVVLLHGQPGSSGDWQPVTALLGERMRVVAPDRPGYGRTGGRAVGFRRNSDALIALLDSLGIGSAVLAAHSWGTGVALVTAARFPERVGGLVLASPVAPDIPPGAVDRLLASPGIGTVAAWLGFRIAGLGLALPPVRRLSRVAVPALSAEQVAATAAAWRTGSVPRSFHAEQRALVSELPTLTPDLAAVDRPATILYGTRDRISPPAHARSLARSLPRARLIRAERVGHMLPQQRPELVAEVIERVASHSTRPRRM
jgi:pimeloyl-ACP methyl ester carboxylesterase